jgi:hypothetical protein
MKLHSTMRAVAGITTLLAAAAVQAHPGHGLSAPTSLMHALESEHLLPLLALLAIGYGVVLVRAIRRRRTDARKTKQDNG